MIVNPREAKVLREVLGEECPELAVSAPVQREPGGPPYEHVLGDWWRPQLGHFCLPYLPPPPMDYGYSLVPALDFIPFTVSRLTPGEIWRRDVAEASAVLAGSGAAGGFVSAWSCFRCAAPAPLVDSDPFAAPGRCSTRRVEAVLVPAWQAGRVLEVLAV